MKKASGKIFLALVVLLIMCNSVPAYSAKMQRVPIFLYHDIQSDDEFDGDNPFVISTENFEAQMKYLYDNNYNTISLDELYQFVCNKQPLPPKSVMIHFDDGYYNNIVHAYPILKKYGFKATLFLIASKVEDEENKEYMNKEDMELARDVFEYASHTYDLHKTDDDGNSILLSATKDTIIEDIKLSTDLVDYKNYFSYPYGQYNNDTIEALQEAGIEMAFSITEEYVKNSSNPYKLSRYTIYRRTPLIVFKKYANGA